MEWNDGGKKIIILFRSEIKNCNGNGEMQMKVNASLSSGLIAIICL